MVDILIHTIPAHTLSICSVAVTLRVYTMKEGDGYNMTFASGRLTTAEQIVDRMLEELGMDKQNKKVFSIWLTSRHLRECVCVCVCVCVTVQICVIDRNCVNIK